jgi:hypothetical protein
VQLTEHLVLEDLRLDGFVQSTVVPQLGPFPWHSPSCSSDPSWLSFVTQENFCTDNLQFEGTDFEMAYNAFMGRPKLSNFMAIPHYAYLVLKMPGPHGVISIRGDAKQAYDSGRESCEMADRLMASADLQDLKQALVESPLEPVMPEANTSMMSIQSEDLLSKTIPLSTEEPSNVAHVGNNLDPK